MDAKIIGQGSLTEIDSTVLRQVKYGSSDSAQI